MNSTEPIVAAKSFAGKVVMPAVGRAALFAVFIAVVFFVAGWIAYSGIAALLLPGANAALRAIVALLIILAYTCAGAVIGLSWGAASSIARKLSSAEQLIHQITASLTGRVLERIPFGQQGISTEQFIGYVDREINTPNTSNGKSSIGASAGAIARGVLRRFLPLVRNLLVVHFVQDLNSKGETMVTSVAVERFTREKMVGLASNFMRVKLYAIRKVASVAFTIGLIIPIALVALRTLR